MPLDQPMLLHNLRYAHMQDAVKSVEHATRELDRATACLKLIERDAGIEPALDADSIKALRRTLHLLYGWRDSIHGETTWCRQNVTIPHEEESHD